MKSEVTVALWFSVIVLLDESPEIKYTSKHNKQTKITCKQNIKAVIVIYFISLVIYLLD